MSIKSKYYKLTKDEFAQYLDSLKNAPGTRFFMEQSPHPYFYCMLPETYQALMKLNRARIEFDKVMDEFSEFGRRQLVQSFLIDEIKATNTIESIASTRHDIFSIINKVKSAENKKIVSIGNAYVLLLQTAGDPVCRPEDVRIIYDLLMENAIDGKDMPDGEFFRKGPVYITDGMRKIHTGIEGEASINQAMEDFLGEYNSESEVFEKMIISHFLIETIHPYYDGNGRLGRFLFSKGVYDGTGSLSAFLAASALAENRKKYYNALKNAREDKEFGCLNDFVETVAGMLRGRIEGATVELKKKLKQINNPKRIDGLSRSGEKVYALIAEATVLSEYGVSNTEIVRCTGISKRTAVTEVNKLRSRGLLADTKIGYYTYHKLK